MELTIKPWQRSLRIVCSAFVVVASGCGTNSAQPDSDDAATTTLAPATTTLPMSQATGLIILTAAGCQLCEEAIGKLTELAGQDSVHVYEATTGYDELPTVFLVDEHAEHVARWSGPQVIDLAEEIISDGCRVHPHVCPGWTRSEPSGPVP